jgi:type IV secretory pathway ATPase VirB11/archaellum biosynthesis ATPase
MTTQEKTAAIQAIVRNHQDNIAAMHAANVGQGLEDLVIEAMNTAFKDDLAVIFAANSNRPTAANQRTDAAVQKVRQTRRT